MDRLSLEIMSMIDFSSVDTILNVRGEVKGFKNNVYDLILCHFVLNSCFDDDMRIELFDDLRTMLNGGGSIIVAELMMGKDESYFEDMFSECGFDVDMCKTIKTSDDTVKIWRLV